MRDPHCSERRRRTATPAIRYHDENHGTTAGARARYIAFLRAELMILPQGHPMHTEYATQLDELERSARSA